MITRSEIEKLVGAEQLLLLGVVALGAEPAYERFAQWLDKGRHADMQYLAQNLALRADPRQLLPGAQCAIVVAMPYGLSDEFAGDFPRVAMYARYRDYHKIMRQKCAAILAQLQLIVPGLQGRPLVDSAPILERALAARTRAGFIGKNTCYIHPQHGSFLLLAEILVTEFLPIDTPADVAADRRDAELGGCGTCKRCQVHCPTGALDADYQIDARKCLAYWTIEHRGTIPREFWPWLARYWFGCDICQTTCPYNRGAKPAPVMATMIPEQLDLYDVATMEQSFYEKTFGGTPMTRAKREGLRRNALIAMAVTGHPRLDAALSLAEADAADVLRDTAAMLRDAPPVL